MAALPPNGAIKPTGLVPMESKNQDLINRVKQYENIPWCEQYERMISGMLYDSTVEILEVARLRSRKIQKKYIDHLPDDATPTSLGKEREEILRSHVGQLGKGCWIEAPLTILDCGLVTIGHRVMFGPFVSIYAATHETEVASRRDNIEFARERGYPPRGEHRGGMYGCGWERGYEECGALECGYGDAGKGCEESYACTADRELM
ncbi:putative acetyltransferase C18B11.09c [Glarea lozoyensis 74030]|uniref:Putative acetyltransferase C18B11.09c n=1 Tax=Glarea lozoyensis (strain ATCC 74030 / MF5533) TaxID=1104152 RepID=H0ET01_GLAL7|nr:putative acetyltransferase C18B11.09c [Glarea lozoyensis 74030]